ncbi:MAG: helix-turn-helix domain-containing protein [Clostridiales bacterium]|nr:helix-turn-helix domain-containing protein [Clostridiales bacterium]
MDAGKRIEQARAAANMTQQELADRLFVSRELVSKWETGMRRPDHNTFLRIAEVLSVPAESIIDNGSYMFPELEACVPPGKELSSDALSALLSAFLRTLNIKDAGIFIRKYYLLDNNSEIARFYGMKENQVRSRISKTLKKLTRYLKEAH